MNAHGELLTPATFFLWIEHDRETLTFLPHSPFVLRHCDG
jgi:hypothetical protein